LRVPDPSGDAEITRAPDGSATAPDARAAELCDPAHTALIDPIGRLGVPE
jgi:hypothetical protein